MKTGASLKNRQGGAVAVMVGISMVLLVGFLAMVIDLGHLYVAKTGLQNAADAAALSGAKQLDGTSGGVTSARNKAIETAGLNTFFDSTGQTAVALDSSNIYFCDSPSCASWASVSDASSNPSNMYFIKVDTASRNLTTWFAPIWGVLQTSTFGMAVAGRFPPGSLSPVFVPVVRRNVDQVIPTNPEFPYCHGVIYDPSALLDNKKCPYDKKNCVTDKGITTCVPYRVPDNTGNWGFLTANENNGVPKSFPAISGVPGFPGGLLDCPVFSGGVCMPELLGSYYVITPRPNDPNDATAWVSGTAWTGNFGFMLGGSPTQPDLAAALCRGGNVTNYSVPGCGPVHTGFLSGDKMADNINTRFDLHGNQVKLPHTACPSDTNISQPSSGNWTQNGYYADYIAGTPLVSPTDFPPGKANRRIFNVYVVDNAWLPGENLTGSNDDTCWEESLRGGSLNAHTVGCAQFFLWKQADKGESGKIFGEYIRKMDTSQCRATIGTEAEIKLYQ